MLAEQRHRAIMSSLESGGGARVADLARTLKVTEETIRRDLEKLGSQGKLIRTHGGAVPLSDDRRDLPFAERETAHLEAKRIIALRSLAMVEEGDVIALDASSTAHELARVLPDIQLTVVTNSLPVQMTLLGRSNVSVVSTGGVIDPRSRSCTGPLTEQILQRLHIGKLFFSAKGFDPVRGLSETTQEQAYVKRRMMDLADRRILLLDHSKFAIKSVVLFAKVGEVDVLVTDENAPRDAIAELEEAGLETVIAEAP